MKNIFLNVKRNLSILDIIISLFLGVAFAASPNYYTTGDCDFNINIILKGLGFAIIFTILAIAFRVLIMHINNSANNKFSKFDTLFDKNKSFYKYRIIIIASIILLFWMPVLCSLYPGTASNDTWGQFSQFYSLKNKYHYLKDNHPILTTIIIGIIIVPLSKITGKWHVFMFLYVILQAIATSIAFSYSLVYAKEKLKLNNKYIIFFLVLYCILPIFPCSIQAINKDALFSWIYVLFFINYIEIVRTNGECLNDNKTVYKIIVLSILACLTKKVGMYVVIISIAIMFLTQITNKKRLLIPFVIIIVFMKIIMPFTLETFEIQKGGEQEKYSMLFQQTARYLKYHRNDVTEDEKQIIEEVIGKSVDNIAEVYNPIFADPVKGYTQRTQTENYKKYILVWLKQGLRHPVTYLDATGAMISGWISFKEYKPLMNMEWHSQLKTNIVDESVTVRTLTNKSANFIQDTYDKIYDIPLIGILLTPGLYTVLIPSFAFITTIKYRKKNLYWVGIIPLIVSIILGCFLAPDSGNTEGQRYLYPITYTTIITLMWVIYCMKSEKIKK